MHLGCTHMHVQHLSISSAAADSSCHDHQLVLGYKVAYAALLALGFSSWVGLDIELER